MAECVLSFTFGALAGVVAGVATCWVFAAIHLSRIAREKYEEEYDRYCAGRDEEPWEKEP